MKVTSDTLSRLSGRVTRWGFFVLAVVLGSTVLISAITSYVGTEAALDTVIRGQAVGLNRQLRQTLFEYQEQYQSRPTNELLEEFIEEHADEGVRYAALMGPQYSVMAEAGASTGPKPRPQDDVRVIGDRVQAWGGPRNLPPRPEGKRPPWGKGPPPWDMKGPPHGGPPPPGFGPNGKFRRPPPLPTMIEFIPHASNDLQSRITRDLLVGIIVGLALILAAVIFWRLSLRAQAVEAHLAEQRHLAALGEMSAVLAHEIRNPLAALKGHAQLLAEKVEGDAMLERKTARIVDASQRLETLTHSLLDFARISQVKRRAVDPTAILRRCADACSAPVELDTEHAPSTWALDETRIEQVLTNLLDNAAQASSMAGPDTPVRARILTQHRRLVFEIRDHGPGVPPEESERIFEPFHTTRTRGTGLGLAVTQRIVELHGGTIELRSPSGGGACFRVDLPAHDPT